MVGPACGLPLRQGSLQDAHFGHGAVAEMAVDALDRLMALNSRRGRGPARPERSSVAPGRPFVASLESSPMPAARPFQSLRGGITGDLLANDHRPIGDQRGGGKTELLEGLMGQLRHVLPTARAEMKPRDGVTVGGRGTRSVLAMGVVRSRFQSVPRRLPSGDRFAGGWETIP